MTSEQVNRLKLMAHGEGDWDLSPNDMESLKAILAELAAMTASRDRWRAAALAWRELSESLERQDVSARLFRLRAEAVRLTAEAEKARQ